MALSFLDKLKEVDLGKTFDTISNIASSVMGPSESDEEVSESDKKDKVQTIDSIESLGDYLQGLQEGASPAIVMALQSQLQLLKHVKSPTMSLMAIDNIMVCLYKSLKSAESKQAKEELREVFASLLQSFIFVSEAQLKYEIDSNKEESVRLLAEAGDMLMSSVSAVGSLAIPMAAGAKVGRALPKMVNVLATNTAQGSFLSRLILVRGRKDIIEEKKCDFDKTLNFIFETLDKYAELIGPSILLYGMLNRYAHGLVERFSMEQYKSVAKSIGSVECDRLDSLVGFKKDAPAPSESNPFSMLFSSLSQNTDLQERYNYESMLSIKRTLQSDLKNKETKLEKINNEIAAVEEEIGKCSILQMSKKKTLQSELETLKTSYNAALSQVEEVEERIRFVADIIDPVDKKIEDYRTKLYGTVAKFEFTI